MREKQKTVSPTSDDRLPDKLALHTKPRILRERKDDAPLYTFKPERIYLPEGTWGVGESGGRLAFNSYDISFYIKLGLDLLLKDRFKNKLKNRPSDVLILGPGVQGLEEMKGLAEVFQINTIDALDGFSGNLSYLQKLLRDAPDLKDKTSLFHAGFDDMKILGGKKYDVIFASDIFSPDLWERGDIQRRIRGEPLVTDSEKLKILGSWFDEAARHLKEPEGVFITYYRHTVGEIHEKLHHRAIRTFPNRTLVAIWCRDDKIFKTKGNVEYSPYQKD